LNPGIIGGSATDEIEMFGLVSRGENLQVESFRPVVSLVFHPSPGIPIFVDTFKGLDDSFGNVTFLDEGRTHADDQVRRTQIPWATDRAGFAGATGPEFFFLIDTSKVIQNEGLMHQTSNIEGRVERNGTSSRAFPTLDATEEFVFFVERLVFYP
jgi:hypothetical protein